MNENGRKLSCFGDKIGVVGIGAHAYFIFRP